jgi:tRNA pseudouridine55 synthase
MSKPRRPRRTVSGILLLDKPLGWSSNAALIEVRKRYQADKAGHIGSLDPLATGLLPICLGQATKLCGQLLASDKCYRATVVLGASTDTGDVEGQVTERSDLAGYEPERLSAVAAAFLGPQQQTPPMYSAIKQQGVRLYQLAREGEVVERAPRDIVIHALSLVPSGPDRFDMEVRCSKGTYVRVLAEDIARALGQVGHLVALRRTAAGPFQGPMLAFDALTATSAQGGLPALDALLLPLSAALPEWARVAVSADQAALLRRGGRVPLPGAAAGDVAVIDPTGDVVCLGEVREAQLQPRRWLSDRYP